MHRFLCSVLSLALWSSPLVAQAPASQPATPPEKTITQQEAAELFRSVDELTRFASKATGLPLKRSVKRELTSRDRLEQFLLEKLEDDEDAKRFERGELVIKKFGLLPADFQLRPFLVKLLREQVAGYYDSKKKTIYMLDWLSADVQRPVLAHELAHALQDQSIDLEKWMKQAREQAQRHNRSQADAEFDEAAVARSAVTEGQAMAVLVDYLLSQAGRTIDDSPEVVESLIGNMESLSVGPLAGSAPLLIRESLVFPYRDGLRFTYALLKAGGKARAFSGALSDPPATTHHVLSPQSYLAGERIAPLNLPDLKPALKGAYDIYDIGSVGEFDISVLIRELGGGQKLAAEIAPHWRGGIYLAAAPKGRKPATTRDIALVYLSRWSSPEKARAFADFYSGAAAKRAREKISPGAKSGSAPDTIEIHGEYALVLESFDATTAKGVRASILQDLAKPSEKSVAASPNLTSPLAAPLAPIRALLLEPWLAQIALRVGLARKDSVRVIHSLPIDSPAGKPENH
jgi:hypothetical protein